MSDSNVRPQSNVVLPPHPHTDTELCIKHQRWLCVSNSLSQEGGRVLSVQESLSSSKNTQSEAQSIFRVCTKENFNSS